MFSPWWPNCSLQPDPAALDPRFLLPSRTQQFLSWDIEQTTHTWPCFLYSLYSCKKLSLNCRHQLLRKVQNSAFTRLTESPSAQRFMHERLRTMLPFPLVSVVGRLHLFTLSSVWPLSDFLWFPVTNLALAQGYVFQCMSSSHSAYYPPGPASQVTDSCLALSV